MLPKFETLQSNTPEEMREYLALAIEVFAEAEIPDDLRAVAFNKLLDWAAAKQLIATQTPGLAVPRFNG